MAYDYQTERNKLFTEDGSVVLIKVRDNAKRLLGEAGAFAMCNAWKGVSGTDTWTMMAAVDRLLELREIREVTGPNVPGQHRIFSFGSGT